MAVGRNSVYLVGANALALAIQFFSIPLVIDWIGKPYYGSYLYLSLLCSYVGVIVPDISAAIQKRLTEACAKKDTKGIETTCGIHPIAIITSVSLEVLIFAAMVLFVRLKGSTLPVNTQRIMISLAGVQFVSAMLATRYYAILYATERFRIIASIQSLGSFIGACTSIGCTYWLRSPVGMCIGMAVISTYSLIAATIMCHLHCRQYIRIIRINWPALKDVALITLKAYPNNIILSLSGGADRLLMPYAGASQRMVADYSIPYRIPEMLVNLLNPVLLAIVPDLTKQLATSMQAFSKSLEKYATTAIWLSVALVLVPSGLGKPFLHLWLQNKAPEHGEYVTLLIGVYMCLNFYFNALVKGFVARGEMHLVAPFSFFNAAMTVSLSIPAVIYGGIVGLALMNFMINIVQIVPFIYWTIKHTAKHMSMRTHLLKVLAIVGIGMVIEVGEYFLCITSFGVQYPILVLATGPIFVAIALYVPVALKIVELPQMIKDILGRLKGRFTLRKRPA